MDLPAEQEQAIERAIEFHSSGNLDAATEIYRAVLDAIPEQPDALHYLGVISLQAGEFEEAVSLIRQAIRVRPEYVDAIVNLGYGLNALKQHEAAAEQFERAMALAPPSANVLANLGASLQQLGRYSDAIRHYESALELQPDLTETRRSLADTLLKKGRSIDALREITKAHSAGRPSIAMQLSLANILSATGHLDDAILGFDQILRANPDAHGVRSNLAKVLRNWNKTDEAIEQYKILLDKDPGNVDACHELGVLYQELNRKEDALAFFRSAVELDETSARSWLRIAVVRKDAFDDADVESLVKLQNNDGISVEQRLLAAFALGKFFENSGRHKEAAAQYLRANRITRAELPYDKNYDPKNLPKIAGAFDTEFLERWSEAGLPDTTPIFIVGMHRSGTSLVEQILASHPNVFAAGELPLLAHVIGDAFPLPESNDYAAAFSDASIEKFQTVARSYLVNLPEVSEGRIVDKLPHNFLHVGMIRILFPNASIVHCRRDPRDTCFSIYKNMFGALAYTFDLEELAHYYNAYAALMNHWDAVLPGVVHTVQYETLINEQEQSTRELLDACGLEWDSACLDFHNHDRRNVTISTTQVRQPLYRGSVGAWQEYEEMLRPLLDILDVD